MTRETAQQRAIQRAVALGVAGEVERVRYGWYRVASTTTPGQAYTVRVVDGRYTCDCAAGRSARPCVHAAGVFIAKVEHASKGRVTGPALALASTRSGVPATVLAQAQAVVTAMAPTQASAQVAA